MRSCDAVAEYRPGDLPICAWCDRVSLDEGVTWWKFCERLGEIVERRLFQPFFTACKSCDEAVKREICGEAEFLSSGHSEETA
ncbi:MAG: hypothetical protein GY937_22450 [bacterium]|nr:hypothetical protein [bacterium]